MISPSAVTMLPFVASVDGIFLRGSGGLASRLRGSRSVDLAAVDKDAGGTAPLDFAVVAGAFLSTLSERGRTLLFILLERGFIRLSAVAGCGGALLTKLRERDGALFPALANPRDALLSTGAARGVCFEVRVNAALRGVFFPTRVNDGGGFLLLAPAARSLSPFAESGNGDLLLTLVDDGALLTTLTAFANGNGVLRFPLAKGNGVFFFLPSGGGGAGALP